MAHAFDTPDIESPENSPTFQKYPRVLSDHHLLDFIVDSTARYAACCVSRQAARTAAASPAA